MHKPRSLSSAQVVRDVQAAFTRSKLFAASLAAEKTNRDRLSSSQKRRRKDKSLKVKVGHGGTLDPLATGVLIIGIGTGTKALQSFLGCTKTYEVDVLFGAATDTYDILGKVLKKAPYAHITRDFVEKKLAQFKGSIMQRPPVYSALRVQGKHLYEYAREGKEIPVEIQERPVTVHTLELTEWIEHHMYEWPKEGAGALEKGIGERVLQLEKASASTGAVLDSEVIESGHILSSGVSKRKRQYETSDVSANSDHSSEIHQPKKIAGSLLSASTKGPANIDITSLGAKEALTTPSSTDNKPPVVSLRMTVSSGFYVRSLCHDLGMAVGSLGIMARLVRTRQGNFELNRNVLDYGKLELGEEAWRPDIDAMLRAWDQGLKTVAGSDEKVATR